MSRGGQRHQSTRQAPTPCGCERSAAWNDPDLSQLPGSTAVEPGIASADMVLIDVNTPTQSRGLGAGQSRDLRWIEALAYLCRHYGLHEVAATCEQVVELLIGTDPDSHL